MKIPYKSHTLALALTSACLLGLYGCGGGGGGSGSAAPATASTTTAVPVTVIDGAIGNATVCLDKNLSNTCDVGEPSGKTDAAGKVILQVEPADAGKFPVLAVVGTDAVDADSGPVPVAFKLLAPADQPAVVSPLTTLVQTIIAGSGQSTAAAEASARSQTGLNISLFEDFTGGATAESQAAGTVARMLVVTTQRQATALNAAVGSSALDGKVITQADIEKIIRNKLLEILPALLTALNDPSVQAATTPAAKEAALLAQANLLVNDPDTGLGAGAAPTLVAINNQIALPAPVSAGTPAASVSLRNLTFTNLQNWFVRAFASTAAQNTADSAGNVRAVDRRANSVAGAVANWNFGGEPIRQADLFFDGSAWAQCTLNVEIVGSVRDLLGNSAYRYCGELGKTNLASFPIGGQTMASVITNARGAGYTNISIGNNSAAILATTLASTTFPAGSVLSYVSTMPQFLPVKYYPGSSARVTQYSPSITAGGVASTQPAGAQCNSPEFNTDGALSTTLEALIAAMTGTPCIFTGGSFVYQGATYTNPDAANEAWGNSTVSLGFLGSAAVGTGPAPGFYTSNTVFRVAFKGSGANATTYYACRQRFNTGSSRNCRVIGTGSYAISVLGDARIMTFTNLPAATAALPLTRVFVERGGRIYYGYQLKLNPTSSARLNLPATHALLTQLGLPVIDPDTPLALTRTSYAGEWDLVDNDSAQGSLLMRLSNDGSTLCTPSLPVGSAAVACTLAFTNVAAGAFTLAVAGDTATYTGSVNFLSGAVSGSYTDTAAPTSGTFAGSRR